MYELAELFANLTERPITDYGYNGHIPEVPWQDVSYALGIAGRQVPGSEHLLRIRYAHTLEEMEKPSFRDILYNLELSTWQQSTLFFYHLKGTKVRDFTRLAIAEHLDPHRCDDCHGVGRKLTPEGQWLVCPTCHADKQGEGHIRPTEDDRARILVPIADPKERLREWWKLSKPYHDILNLLSTMESKGLQAFKRALWG